MKKFKLGFGPMSKLITQALALYSARNSFPLMIIASRNQVDASTGYVCQSAELVELVKEHKTENLLVCRDHCGPYFADADRSLTLEQAVARCKETIAADIAAGFDLIHIDVSRVKEDPFAVATELFDYALSQNPNIKFEFGSEDNTGIDINSSIARIESQLEFLEKYKDNLVFFVSQTGSLTKESQAGQFDVELNKQTAQKIHAAGLLFKEHNADYFSTDDLTKRANAGIDSLNIAPQLGKIQTTITQQHADKDAWAKFADYVYQQGYWKRWVSDQGQDRENAVAVSAHYCFATPEYQAVLDTIQDSTQFEQAVQTAIFTLVDFYKRFVDEAEFQEKLQKRLEELRRRDPFIYR
jgi:hypothetical protein